MYNRQLRCVALGLTLSLWAVGCSALPEGDESDTKKKEEATGPTYDQAMDAMYPDVLSAARATTPDVEPEESSSGQDCGGLDISDGKDGSKRIGTATIRVPGDPSDKRKPDALVKTVVDHLIDKGWTVEDRQETTMPGKPDSVIKYLKKSKTKGSVSVFASPFKLASGKISQTLGAKVVTDCLRNPDWNKE